MTTTPQPLWPAGAPGTKGTEPADMPTLHAVLPEKPNGAAIIVAPGGGYGTVVDHEKYNVAEYFARLGLTAFVLIYRVGPRYQHPAMLHDVARAVRTVRSQAKQYNIDPNRIAIIGFSAGGHLAATISVHHDPGDPSAKDPIDRVSSRPDLAILCYPVITMDKQKGHIGSMKNLLGPEPKPSEVELMSLELQVRADTPPTFIYHRTFDGVVPPQHPLLYAIALAEKNVPFELHVYDHKGHGSVFALNDPIDRDWPDRLINWLRRRGF
jgi:acetyl esterase/lipase